MFVATACDRVHWLSWPVGHRFMVSTSTGPGPQLSGLTMDSTKQAMLSAVLAAARLALSSGLLVGVFTMAAVVLAVQVCLSGARSLVGRQISCLCSTCGDLVVWSDVASLRSWWLPLCHFVNRRFQASRSRLSFAPCPDFTVLLGWSNGL
jgi:hypothetical protein